MPPRISVPYTLPRGQSFFSKDYDGVREYNTMTVGSIISKALDVCMEVRS